MNKSAEEAEREVEACRGELDRTVEALKDKMTPGQLLDEATRTLGDTGAQIFSKFVDQAKENPMPLAVMGLGLAWLMASSNRSRGSSPTLRSSPYVGSPDGTRPDSDGLAANAGRLAGNVSDRLGHAAHSASDAAGAMADRVSETASGVVDKARDAAQHAKAMAGSAADKAVQYGQRAQQTAADMMDREPLIVGGLGLLAGLAIGASLPATEAEKRYVAPIKDKVVDKTMAMAQDRLDDVSEAAQAAYAAVKDELAQGGTEGQSLADRADHVVHAAGQSLRDQVSGPH